MDSRAEAVTPFHHFTLLTFQLIVGCSLDWVRTKNDELRTKHQDERLET